MTDVDGRVNVNVDDDDGGLDSDMHVFACVPLPSDSRALVYIIGIYKKQARKRAVRPCLGPRGPTSPAFPLPSCLSRARPPQIPRPLGVRQDRSTVAPSPRTNVHP